MIRSAILFMAILVMVTLNTAVTQAQDQLQSPDEFLGYELGSHFTPHHNILNYMYHVAQHTDRVTINPYGTTYEGRELILATVTSVENQKNIEAIRSSNLARTGLIDETPNPDQPAIVWLSYNVHGNETSSSEAALKTLYFLANPDNERANKWLENVVVLMDPMLNPDGRDRYVNWYKQARGVQPNANVETREHREPWPGGRTNHYYFDLNRDWAWQIQKETAQRIEVYNRWMPQIHVDYHEQGKDDHYYFAPAAVPFHRAISSWQREFQTSIGKNHTRYFNEKGWLYFTRDIFDLFYPSYGDTWPTFNGSIGMTYEQAGHSLGGLAVETNDLDTLTLAERIEHHFTTGLSTVETAAVNRGEVLEAFSSYFRSTINNGSGSYNTFVIKAGQNADAMDRLLSYLDRQQIVYGNPDRAKTYEGFDYRQNSVRKIAVNPDDIVISTRQPKGVLARVLFEPKPELTDSLTYDITAWSVPYAYGLEAYAMNDALTVKPFNNPVPNIENRKEADAFAYITRWKSLNDVRFLADLLKNNIKVRFSEVPFTIDDETYKEGSLIITRLGNETAQGEFGDKVIEIADKHNRAVNPVSTGYVEQGGDFGSDAVSFLKKPRVALLAGEEISSNRFGEIWHFFDRQINYPVHIIKTSDVDNMSWHNYDVLILPSGNYNELFNNTSMEQLEQWLKAGGRVIAMESANRLFEGRDQFGLKYVSNSKDGDNEDPVQQIYANRSRKAISNFNSGAIYRVSMDETHPLAFGYDDTYFSLKLGTNAFQYLETGWNVGVLEEKPLISGFAGYKARKKLEHTLVFGVQNMGSGKIIYMVDNPLFRGFWHNGKLLFANAVFMVH